MIIRIVQILKNTRLPRKIIVIVLFMFSGSAQPSQPLDTTMFVSPCGLEKSCEHCCIPPCGDSF